MKALNAAVSTGGSDCEVCYERLRDNRGTRITIANSTYVLCHDCVRKLRDRLNLAASLMDD